VVSGIVMPFQFGTNWSRFSDAAASVIGSLMAYEVLTAFYLEAAFLGVLLFGRKLVPQWAHVFSALMVAFGTLMSSFWILAVNSWMQAPQGPSLWTGVSSRSACWRCCSRRRFVPPLAHGDRLSSPAVVISPSPQVPAPAPARRESRVMVKALAFLSIMVR
jgi:cytochrome d ubiquinol oxidase subunit I